MKKLNQISILLTLLALLVVGCSGVSMISNKDFVNPYSDSFSTLIKSIKQDFSQGHVELALKRLQEMNEETLNPSERAFRRNLTGVILFGKKNYEQAIFNFDQALTTSREDPNLTAQIYLNLSSSYYKLGFFEKAFENLQMVKSENLYQNERKKFFKLKYLTSKELGNSREVINSLINYLAPHKKLSELKSEPLFEHLVNDFFKLDNNEKLKILEENEDGKSLVIGYLGYLEAEKLYYKSQKDEAHDLLEWLEKTFGDHEEIDQLVKNFFFRAKNYAKLDLNSIGVILPLSGDSKNFGNRALLGIDSALRFKTENSPYKIFIKNSEGNGSVGAFHVKELIEKNYVSVIIGGLFSTEATKEYLEARKRGVFFISLSEIHLPKEQKDHLLLEIPGSIESQVDHLFSDEMLNYFGKRAAIIYPKNNQGMAYVNEFWRKAKLKNVEITGAHSFDPKQTDYRESVKNLLGLKFPREREEERELLSEIFSLERRRGSARRNQILKPQLDFDWVFIPTQPKYALQLIPSFSYYDAFRVNMIGSPSWRSRALTKESYKLGRIYFIGDDVTTQYNEFTEYFKEKYKNRPRIVETLAFDAFSAAKNLLNGNNFSSRDELDIYIRSKSHIEGLTGSWKFNDGVWMKDLASLRIRRGGIQKLDTALIPEGKEESSNL